MLVATTTPTVEGYRIREYMGLVIGICLRGSRVPGEDASEGSVPVGPCENRELRVSEHARKTAYQMLIDNAREIGANAVVGIRYDTVPVPSVYHNHNEVLCYGTAVVIEPTPHRA